MKTTSLFGQTYSVEKNLDLILPNGKKITEKEMSLIANEYKGVNRIYKPIALLFWTDVKNGKSSNWELDVAKSIGL
jgi:hypothetical protein